MTDAAERYLYMEAKQLRQTLDRLEQQRVDAVTSYVMVCLREAGIRPTNLLLNDRIRDALEEALP